MQNYLKQQNHPEIIGGVDGDVYRLLEPIGATAGSWLYRARSVQHAGNAMLKSIGPHALSHGQSALFRTEFKLLQGLNLPGVIRPLALVDEPGRTTMILENVEGELLDAVLGRQRLAWPVCLRLASKLAGILAGFHASRIIHRDIRPANE